MKKAYRFFLLTGLFVSSSLAVNNAERKAAFFKHYAQEGRPREIMALYDSKGKVVSSYETTYTPQGRTAEDWWYPYWQNECNDTSPQGKVGWWEIPEIDKILLVEHSPLAGITHIQHGDSLVPLFHSALDKSVIKRLLVEAHIVKYCSLFKRSVKGELANNFPLVDVEYLLYLLARSLEQ